MKYEICNNKIKIFSLEEFNPAHIFECGQVFAYKKLKEDFYVFYPDNYVFLIYKKENFYWIEQISNNKDGIEKAVELFDLETDYTQIKNMIRKIINKKDFIFDRDLIEKAMDYGYGIRILKQKPIETIISFIFSENNNIRRIRNSLDALREKVGEEIKIDYLKINDKEIRGLLEEQKFYSFPKLSDLKDLDERFFTSIGAGYRANYLVDSIARIESLKFYDSDTSELKRELIELKGVGRKVAECILLFGFDKKDVFPVDTWIRKVYLDISREKIQVPAPLISDKLTLEFGEISGYVQQYLFYFKRENK